MRLSINSLAFPVSLAIACVGLAVPTVAFATSCTTQAEMAPTDRDVLAAVGQRLGTAVINQDEVRLQSALLPTVAKDWDGIREAVEQGAPAVKGGRCNCATST